MKIISKYVLREHVGPFTFALTALTSLMLLQYIARRFGDLVGKGIPWQVILKFFLLSVPFTVAMTLPMAVLVAVLYAFSRLASENEITALKAGGVSMLRLMVPALAGATTLAVLMVLFNDQLLPRANHTLAVLQLDIFRRKPTFALKEQVINTVKEGQFYLRADKLDEGSTRMKFVTIYDLSDPVRRRTIYADSGSITMAPNLRDLNLLLHHGVMQSIPTDKPGQLTRLFYNRDLLRIKDVGSGPVELSSTDSATKGDREMTVCEMQQRLVQESKRLHVAREDVEVAQWELKTASGASHPARPAATAPPPTLGIGGIYCRVTRQLSTWLAPKEAKAQATPQPHPMPPSIAPSAGGGGGGAITPTTLGLTPEQRLNQAKASAEDVQRQRNRYDIEIQKKFSLAAACIIFVLIGAPIALRFPRGGVGLVLGVSFFIFALYYVGLIGGESLANNNMLSPFWAMWSANVLMTIVGLFMMSRMGRETQTGRGGSEFWWKVRTLFRRNG